MSTSRNGEQHAFDRVGAPAVVHLYGASHPAAGTDMVPRALAPVLTGFSRQQPTARRTVDAAIGSPAE